MLPRTLNWFLFGILIAVTLSKRVRVNCSTWTGTGEGFTGAGRVFREGALDVFNHIGTNNSNIMYFQHLYSPLNCPNPEPALSSHQGIERVMHCFSQRIFGQGSIYELTFVQLNTVERLTFGLLWKFKETSTGHYFLTLTPYMLDRPGPSLKIDNQRAQVDFLQLLLRYNTRSPFWKIMVNQANQIELKINNLIDPQTFKQTIQPIKAEAISTLEELTAILKLEMFSLEPLEDLPNSNYAFPEHHSVPDSHHEHIFRILFLLETRRQMRRLAKISQSSPKDIQRPQKDTIYQCIKQARKKAAQILSPVMQIQGRPSKLIWNRQQAAVQHNQKHMNEKDQSGKKATPSKSKNVMGVHIVKRVNKERSSDKSEGAHCRLTFGIFELYFLQSIHAETIPYLKKQKNPSSNGVQIELAKKYCKNLDKQPSKNSFLNEERLIMHIKEFDRCHFLPMFYVESERIAGDAAKKQELRGDQQIIMDYYPNRLQKEMNGNQNLMGPVQQLAILKQVVEGLSWLCNFSICHRDIKPDNIMLDSSRVAKIIDFGSSCGAYIKGKKTFQPKDSRLLTTKLYSLSFNKESELLKSRNYTKSSYNQHPLFDCYSFGKVMQEMMASSAKRMGDQGRLLQHICKCCTSELPQDRPTYQQLSFILSHLINYLSTLNIPKYL